MIVAVAMVMTLVCAFAIGTSADTIDFSTLALPTSWGGAALESWDTYAKTAGDKTAANHALNAVGEDWWDCYTTLLYGMHPVIANYDGTTDVVAAYTGSMEAAPAKAVGTLMEKAKAVIDGLSNDKKAALADEIAYYNFFYGKLDEFARNVYDADSLIANVRVLPSIAEAVCAPILGANNAIDFKTLALPTSWNGEALESWDTYAKTAGDKTAANHALNAVGSDWWDCYTTLLYGMHSVIANYDGTTDVVAAYTGSMEAAPANAVGTMMEAAAAKIAGMSAAEKAALADEIAYFNFFYGKLDEFARNVYDADSLIANVRVLPSIAAYVCAAVMNENPDTSDNGVMVAVAIMLSVSALATAAVICRKKFN